MGTRSRRVRVLVEPAGMWGGVAERVRPEGLAWLRAATEELWSDPAAIHARFPLAAREVGEGPLDPAASPDDVHAWTVEDAVRTLLLRALRTRVEGALGDLYRRGDAAERRAILRALPFLPVGDRALYLVEDALASEDARLIAAALGPYATAYLSDSAYEQAVLRCTSAGVPTAPLHGLHRARGAFEERA